MRPHLLLARFAGARRPSGAPVDPGEIDPNAIIVAVNGDNANAGTLASPIASLPEAASRVTPGGTVYVRGGVYDTISGAGQNVYHTENFATCMRFSGTAENPITVKSYPGEWAIFDGLNHPWHPRSFDDGNDPDFGAILITVRGEHLVWEDMEFRNAAGRGTYWLGHDITFRNLISHHHHSDGYYLRTHNALMEFCDGYSNYSISNGGNSADGCKSFHAAILQDDHGLHVGNNTWRDCRFWHNSDDGLDTWNTRNNVAERVYSFANGHGPSTTGRAFKIGGATVTHGGVVHPFSNINTLITNCVGVGRGNFTTNDSTGVEFRNCTHYKAVDSQAYDLRSQYWADAEDGGNEAYNCVAYDYTGLAVSIGANAPVTHTNNSWNLEIGAASDFLSLDPASADYLALSSDSAFRGVGVDGVDIGAFQFGSKFTRSTEMAETLPFWV